MMLPLFSRSVKKKLRQLRQLGGERNSDVALGAGKKRPSVLPMWQNTRSPAISIFLRFGCGLRRGLRRLVGATARCGSGAAGAGWRLACR